MNQRLRHLVATSFERASLLALMDDPRRERSDFTEQIGLLVRLDPEALDPRAAELRCATIEA